jgi:plastocyanin
MKLRTLALVLSVFSAAVVQAKDAAPRVVELHAEMINGAVHWMPAKVEVTQGETVKFVVKHDLKEGFAFHGFSIPALKVTKQVNRGTPLNWEGKVDLAPGEYPIQCQFHPKHVGGQLVVKAAKKS